MPFKRYDGFVGSAPQTKIDKGLPVCPFCGKHPHWLLEIESGFTAKLTCMCEKCHGKLYTESRGLGFDDNFRVVDLGIENINELALNSIYHIKSLNSIASKNQSFENNSSYNSADYPIHQPITSKSSSIKKFVSLFLIFFIIITTTIVIITLCTNDSNNKEDKPSTQESQTTNTQSNDSTSTTTLGERNALRSAKNYLRTMPFSYKGLIKQLEFEGYSTAEATYAADNCGANWNEQAAKSAKNYLDIMAFSKKELIEQLEFEGFTHAQAVYGAEANGY